MNTGIGVEEGMGIFLAGGAVGGKETEYLLGGRTVEVTRGDNSAGAGPADFGDRDAICPAHKRSRGVGDKHYGRRPTAASAAARGHLNEHRLASRDRRAASHGGWRDSEGNGIDSSAQGTDRQVKLRRGSGYGYLLSLRQRDSHRKRERQENDR